MGCKKCNRFSSGKKNRIEIQQYTLTDDGYGSSTEAWNTIATIFAVITPVSGRETFSSEQLESRVTHKMLIRYNSSFKNTKDFAKNRIKFDGRFFGIKHVRNLHGDLKTEGRAFQEFLAEEGEDE